MSCKITLLKRKMVKQKDLAGILSERIGKKYTAGAFAQKVLRGQYLMMNLLL